MHVIRQGGELFNTLAAHFEMVAYALRATTVFFLISEDNFKEAWSLWLLDRLLDRRFNVRLSLHTDSE
jgi:hypothetical protein